MVTAIILNDRNQFLVKKRNEKGLLANFWEFVQVESKTYIEFQEFLKDHDGIEIEEKTYLGETKHVFTHRIWEIKAYSAILKEAPTASF